jgi:hypothetical protein
VLVGEAFIGTPVNGRDAPEAAIGGPSCVDLNHRSCSATVVEYIDLDWEARCTSEFWLRAT